MREAVIVCGRADGGGQGAGKGDAAPDAARRHGGRGHQGRAGARAGGRARMVDDVILGCAMPEAEQGMNVARIASLLAGVPHTAVRHDHQPLLLVGPAGDRAGARTPSQPAAREVAVAGGTESMSLIPMGGHKIAPNPTLLERLSRQLPRHGPDGRAGGEEVRHRPREVRRLRARLAPEGAGRHRGRAGSRTRSCRSPSACPNGDGQPRP